MKYLLSLFLIFCPLLSHAATPAAFDQKINAALTEHYQTYKDKEYFSGIALSILTPKQEIKDYYIGTTGHEENTKKMDKDTLFQIGSITKSFTASIVLQLEKENKLHLSDRLQKWLPEYSKWENLSLTSLLNMTSGLPNYSDAPLLNTAQFDKPTEFLANKDLIDYVYPPKELSPPFKPGYFYCNTGYILMAMIIENLTQQSLQKEIENRLIKPANLNNTFYPLPHMDNDISTRLAHGYGFNPFVNPETLGRDVSLNSLSWAGAAGAIISNPTDIIKWVKALFIDHTILDAKQKSLLMTLVSTNTGKPIKTANANDPRAFGLGVVQGFDNEMGQFWFYEGETLGFRALYLYAPKTKIIIAVIFNSAVDDRNDHASELIKKIYKIAKM